MQRLFINIVHPQQGQRLQLMVTHPFAHVRGALHAATQLFFSGEIEFAQQLCFQLFHSVSLVAQISATVRHTR